MFLLAGPATNVATLAVVGRELGKGALAGYLAGIAVGAVAMGLLTDLVVGAGGFDVTAQIAQSRELIPRWAEIGSGVTVALLAAPALLRSLRGLFDRRLWRRA